MSEIKKVTVEFVADYTKLPKLPEYAGMWSDEDLHNWWEKGTNLLLTAHLLQEFVKHNPRLSICSGGRIENHIADYETLANVLLDMHPSQQQNLWRLVIALAGRMGYVAEDTRNADSHKLAKMIRESDLRYLQYL